MYWLPSASQRRDPSPRTMNGGVPPTLRYARTGELTPPGISACALRNRASDFCIFIRRDRSSSGRRHRIILWRRVLGASLALEISNRRYDVVVAGAGQIGRAHV